MERARHLNGKFYDIPITAIKPSTHEFLSQIDIKARGDRILAESQQYEQTEQGDQSFVSQTQMMDPSTGDLPPNFFVQRNAEYQAQLMANFNEQRQM